MSAHSVIASYPQAEEISGSRRRFVLQAAGVFSAAFTPAMSLGSSAQTVKGGDKSQKAKATFGKTVPSRERWYEESATRELAGVTIDAQIDGGRIIYDSTAAFEYARRYCNVVNECGIEYPGADCTHFMCHCLAAGKIRIKAPPGGANCPAGLNNAVRYLAEAFELMRANYSNVMHLVFDELPRKGDYAILSDWLRPYHAVLLNGLVSANGRSAPIFGHTNFRCGDKNPDSESAEFITGAHYYRIS